MRRSRFPSLRVLIGLGGMACATAAVGLVGAARGLTFLAVIAMHIWKPFHMLDVVVPRSGVTIITGIAYANGPRHRLDLYRPAHVTSQAPVVVFFYGGGWETGDRATYRFVGIELAEHGIVAAIPDYRLHPAVRFPAFEQDAAAAVAWVHANVARYGGDAGRLFLMGHSAGAQIAALLALDPKYLRAEQLSPADLCGVVGLAGPYDLPLTREIKAVFGPRAVSAQPMVHVAADAPPMLLLAGAADGTVDPDSTLRLAARLRATGNAARGRLYPGISHTAILAAIADPLRFLAPTAEATVSFVKGGGRCGEAAGIEGRDATTSGIAAVTAP